MLDNNMLQTMLSYGMMMQMMPMFMGCMNPMNNPMYQQPQMQQPMQPQPVEVVIKVEDSRPKWQQKQKPVKAEVANASQAPAIEVQPQ